MAKPATIYTEGSSATTIAYRTEITLNALANGSTQNDVVLPRGFTPVMVGYYIPALGSNTDLQIGWSAGINTASLVGVDVDGFLASVDTESVKTGVNPCILAGLVEGTFEDDVYLTVTNAGSASTTASDLVVYVTIIGYKALDGSNSPEL